MSGNTRQECSPWLSARQAPPLGNPQGSRSPFRSTSSNKIILGAKPQVSLCFHCNTRHRVWTLTGNKCTVNTNTFRKTDGDGEITLGQWMEEEGGARCAFRSHSGSRRWPGTQGQSGGLTPPPAECQVSRPRCWVFRVSSALSWRFGTACSLFSYGHGLQGCQAS